MAVLVILAILSLITVPIVIKTINNTKSSSYERSIEMFGKAAQQGLLNWAADNDTANYKKTTSWTEFQSTYGSYIKTTGSPVTCTEVKVTVDGELSLYSCSTKESEKKSKYYSYVGGEVRDATDVKASVEYEVGTEIKYKNLEFYVIENSDERDDSIKLLYKGILSKNQINGYANGYLYRPVTNANISYYISDNCNENDQSDCKTDYATSQVKIVIDAWYKDLLDEKNLKESEDGYKARLITYDELKK